MAFAPGDRLPAARLNRLQPVTYRINMLGTTQALTTTETDVAGPIVITTQAANAIYVVYGAFDFDCSVAGAAVAQGRLSVDGTVDTTIEAHMSTATVTRATVAQTWRGTLTAAGSHTFKLRTLKTANVATVVANAGHTSALITIYEVA